MNRNKGKKNSAGAIIVAAGESKRMGGQDKLFARLGGEPLLARVLDAFDGCTAIEQVVVVLREQRIAEAEGYALERINRALGDASLFKQVYAEYRSAPGVTRRRLYLETMGEILPKLKDIYIVDDKQKSILPLLDLGAGRKGGDAE